MTKIKAKTAAVIFVLAGFPGLSALHADYGPGREEHLGDLDQPVQKKLDLMSKKLDLSPEQGFRVKAALEDQATKLDLLHKEYAEARKKIADDTDGAFMSILNPQQQEAYQKIKPDILGKDEGSPDNARHGSIPSRGYLDEP